MFKLSNFFENSVAKVGGAETSKFGPIPQFGDFRSKLSVLRLQDLLKVLYKGFYSFSISHLAKAGPNHEPVHRARRA